ncbi:MAG TPA: hypothetical protein VGV38_16840, partial [Pyrinomonadaceae bacterium]|nr:hypothetical protein [Pyrinomonadaceae bacterium]
MIAESELWQVYTHGEVLETDTETLKQWVSEGYVGRTDKVKKGALTWIEAGRAPLLRPIFTGEERVGAAPPARDAAKPTRPRPAPAHASATTARTATEPHAAQTAHAAAHAHASEPFLVAEAPAERAAAQADEPAAPPP